MTNNLRFQGQYFDSETGLHYNYHRTYDPNLGRYTQPDPIGLNGGSNRFGYVGGNPIRWIDPLGLRRYGSPAEAAAMASAEAWGQIPGQYPNDPKDLKNVLNIVSTGAMIFANPVLTGVAVIGHVCSSDWDGLGVDLTGLLTEGVYFLLAPLSCLSISSA